MTAAEILDEIKPLGKDSYKKVLLNHGVREPVFGVSIEIMKKLVVKRVKKDYELSKDLYDTEVYDAMYLAGLIADDKKMTKKDLKHWVAGAYCSALSQYTVPWVAAESNHGHEMALEWIESRKELTAVAGWATYSGLTALKPDAELDIAELKKLLQRIQKSIHDEPNRVRYAMNCFVIAVGSYVAELTDTAIAAAEKIGPVNVDMHGTACKVPSAPEYIRMVQQRGTIGKKRKTVKC